MTAAKAAQIRAKRATKDQPSNQEKRDEKRAILQAQQNQWTIQRLWEEYKKSKPIKSLQKDQQRFSYHIAAKFGNKEPSEIAPLDIDRLRINLLKDRKPATVKNILELLRRIVNFGIKRGLCEPLKFTIEMPEVNNLKTEDLSSEQLQRLLEVLDEESNMQLENLMKFVLFTGMRRGEVLNLKWKDIDFDRGFIWIREPKGGKDEKIPLNEVVRELLREHLIVSEWVFPANHGGQRKDSKKEIRAIADKAGIPRDFRPLHGLRHVYASMLASSGKVDMYTLQKLLTHKSPQMTQRYAHLRDKALKKASEVAVDIIQETRITNEQNGAV